MVSQYSKVETQDASSLTVMVIVISACPVSGGDPPSLANNVMKYVSVVSLSSAWFMFRFVDKGPEGVREKRLSETESKEKFT